MRKNIHLYFFSLTLNIILQKLLHAVMVDLSRFDSSTAFTHPCS
nr:MAG TPA: hypothetical protein [Caudoviricetes sp.]